MISIIVPVFNVEKYLARCLDSIIGQTYTEWECILVNDGSTDGSEVICKKYALCDDRIQYIEQRNKGQACARNTAIKKASGEYYCFIDSDDWVEPTYIERLYREIVDKQADLVVCGFFCSTDKDDRPVKILKDDVILKQDDFVHKIMVDEIQSFMWNKLYPARLFEQHAYKEGVYYEDVILWNEIMTEVQKIVVINTPLYHYYMRENSTIHTRSLKRECDYFNAFKERFELEFIGIDEKVIILKILMISYYYIVQAYGDDFFPDNEFRKYLRMQSWNYILKARKKMRLIECVRYDMSMYCPKIYQWIIKKLRS